MYRKLLLLMLFSFVLPVGAMSLETQRRKEGMEQLQNIKKCVLCCICICSIIETPARQCSESFEKQPNRGISKPLQLHDYTLLSHYIPCSGRQGVE